MSLDLKYVHNLNAFFGVWHEEQLEPKIPKWNAEKERERELKSMHKAFVEKKKVEQTEIY